MIGFPLAFMGGLLTVGAAFDQDLEGELAVRITIFAFGLIVAGTGRALLVFGKRMLALADAAHLDRDRRPPVLYLRSFRDDPAGAVQTRAHFFQVRSFSDEEQLAWAVQKRVGPFVAVGRPGERLPPVGAKRIPLPEDRWRTTVSALMGAAALVVVRTGDGPNLHWEMAEARHQVPPDRVVVLVGGDAAAYTEFRRAAEQAGWTLPDPPANVLPGSFAGWAVTFATDGTPKATSLSDVGSAPKALSKRLAALLAGVAAKPRRPAMR